MKSNRISMGELYMQVAKLVAKRSTCLKRKVGCVIVKDGRLISAGYNGSPRKMKNCCDTGKCLREQSKSGKDLQLCYAVHAEENAILNAAFHGVSVKDSILYTTTAPCSICTKHLVNSGVIEVVYSEDYDDKLSQVILRESKVKVYRYKAEN